MSRKHNRKKKPAGPSLADVAALLRRTFDEQASANPMRDGELASRRPGIIVLPDGTRIVRLGASERALRIRGHVKVERYREATGEHLQWEENHNLVVTTGLDWIKDFCFNTATTQTQQKYIAVGSSNQVVAATDTALISELARQIISAYTAGGPGVCTVETTFAAGVGTGTITEVGLFDANAAGDMWNRVVINPVAKGAGDAVKVTMTFTFSAA
jgi:hypothetical protein